MAENKGFPRGDAGTTQSANDTAKNPEKHGISRVAPFHTFHTFHTFGVETTETLPMAE